ncbi:type II toxin-antitoxin system RelB/DinJ family antitoxin [Lacticaseibacillus daqingensis]|uniref:type II toxin-antitoxin system RelB/DinJ family antitoxin n=1 Tax=Lacticaseibacillus daqingensis TaxID=2486014 RepID=UPI001CDBDD47|nr:type II toxin-antitoxin system RelB/DinJ family antitoxin [Lacticaseibacillus daqingensis]
MTTKMTPKDKRVTIQARTDAETKEQARQTFEAMGMDLSTGINIYLKQVVREGRLPFTPSAADPLEATLADALADVKAGRTERYQSMTDYQAAMDQL